MTNEQRARLRAAHKAGVDERSIARDIGAELFEVKVYLTHWADQCYPNNLPGD